MWGLDTERLGSSGGLFFPGILLRRRFVSSSFTRIEWEGIAVSAGILPASPLGLIAAMCVIAWVVVRDCGDA